MLPHRTEIICLLIITALLIHPMAGAQYPTHHRGDRLPLADASCSLPALPTRRCSARCCALAAACCVAPRSTRCSLSRRAGGAAPSCCWHASARAGLAAPHTCCRCGGGVDNCKWFWAHDIATAQCHLTAGGCSSRVVHRHMHWHRLVRAFAPIPSKTAGGPAQYVQPLRLICGQAALQLPGHRVCVPRCGAQALCRCEGS